MTFSHVGDWRWTTETDSGTDQLRAIFILQATNSAAPYAGAFVLMCEKGRLEAYVDPGQPHDHGYADGVTVRFGTDSPEAQQWIAGPPKGEHWFPADSTALFVSREQTKVRAFVRKLGNNQRFGVRVWPNQASPRDLSFDQGQDGMVSAQIMVACK